MKCLTTIIAALLLAFPVQAQVNVRVNLDDGVALSGQMNIDTLPVKTKYGTLNVPINEVLSITFGLHYDDGQRELITDAVKRLSNLSFKERDEAAKFLVTQGQHTIPFLQMASATEGIRRAETIEQTIREQVKNFLPDQDVIQTRWMEIKGEVVLTHLEIACKHKELGVVKPKLTNIRDVFVQSASKKFELETKEEWFNTNFLVLNGSTIVVTASGLIDLHPASGGQYTASPKGYNSPGKGGRFNAGALIGKIGNDGEFFIGEAFTATSSKTGTLYLRIVDNPWTNQSLGRYSIEVKGR